MVKIKLICIGKNNSKSFDSEIKKYIKRINYFINFSIIHFNNSKLIDKNGNEYNSLEFAKFIKKK